MGWIEHIKAEQLPEDYQILVDAIGLENTIIFFHGLTAPSPGSESSTAVPP